MIQRTLHSRSLDACVLAAAAGMVLYIRMPFPEANLLFELMFLRARQVFLAFKYCYVVLLYTTTYIVYSIMLSGLYIFVLKIPQRIRPGRLPAYPELTKRDDLLVIGKARDSGKHIPAATPYWLTIPDRGLFTGIAIFGVVGNGKTSGMCPMGNNSALTPRATGPVQNGLSTMALTRKRLSETWRRRAQVKLEPEDYARRTVTKAAEELKSETLSQEQASLQRQ